jgi:NAD(P)-dependent dehydrogenase (short-subunit alcohol dehydrogenase family)
MDMEGQVAIVTGGSKGIGLGIAREFMRERASVVISSRNKGALKEAEDELREMGNQIASVVCDVSNEEQVLNLMAETVSRFGRLNIVVNNAGLGIYKSLTETTTEEFDLALAVNLKGVFFCMKHAVPYLKHSGGGSIINIASVYSVQNVGGTVPYAAAKGGVASLTRAAAIDLAREGIRVNAIAPGWVDTPLVRSIFDSSGDPEAARREVEERQLLGRLGRPEDIGRAAVFLASDNSSYMTGSMIFVDNGMTAQLGTWWPTSSMDE